MGGEEKKLGVTEGCGLRAGSSADPGGGDKGWGGFKGAVQDEWSLRCLFDPQHEGWGRLTPKRTSSSPAHGWVWKPRDSAVTEAEGVDGAERRSEDRALGAVQQRRPGQGS